MLTLYHIYLPWATFGVEVDEDGNVIPNIELGHTLTYPTIQLLTEHVERCEGRVEKGSTRTQ